MQDIEYIIGTVKEIKGTSVIVRMFNNSSQLSYFINGERYSGVIIGSYVGIKQGQYVIVGQIEKESAIDSLNDIENITFSKKRFVREFTVKIIGAFTGKKYTQGMVAFPQIFNDVILLSDSEIAAIISGDNSKKDNDSKRYLKIGSIWPNGVDYYLDWTKLFNTHIAIFGNTGSGKSNTLTKLYTELFNLEKEKIINFGESRFVFLDFNGEYVTDTVLTSSKKRIYLNTSVQDNKPDNKIAIPYKRFWNKDLLSTIFGATEQTQQPFLSRIMNYYFKKDDNFTDKIADYIIQAFGEVFGSEADQDNLSLLRDVLNRLNIKYADCSSWIERARINEKFKKFYSIEFVAGWDPDNNGASYYWNPNESALNREKENIKDKLTNLLSSCKGLSNPIFQLEIAVRLQMIHDLSTHMIQYDHIAPLLHRIEARSKDLNKVIKIDNTTDMFDCPITVISLKDVNRDIKMILPMLIARISYQMHKEANSKHDRTFNLVIDEAHNILSEKSSVESEKWKDYRLDVFEEIIKEGRKFGYYLTIASQRPADISPTIVSQIHNYFVHRLVNELDLKMLQNTMSSLDAVSRSNIPTLSPGQVVITGVSFAQPVIVQIDKLDEKYQPDSSNSNLLKIWHFCEK